MFFEAYDRKNDSSSDPIISFLEVIGSGGVVNHDRIIRGPKRQPASHTAPPYDKHVLLLQLVQRTMKIKKLSKSTSAKNSDVVIYFRLRRTPVEIDSQQTVRRVRFYIFVLV